MFLLPTPRPTPPQQPIQDVPYPTLRTRPIRPIRPASAFPPQNTGRRLSLDSEISLDAWPLPSTSQAGCRRRSFDTVSSLESRPPTSSQDPPPYRPRTRAPDDVEVVEREARQVQEALDRSLRPDDHADPMHFDDPPSYADVEQLPQRRTRKKRRLRLLGTLLTILILAGILGAVLGTRLRHSDRDSGSGSSSDSGESHINDRWSGNSTAAQRTNLLSGIATLQVSNNENYLYYFAINGSLMERRYSTSPPSDSSSEGAYVAIADPQAAVYSPIAATPAFYHAPETSQRHIFWISANNSIMTASAWAWDTFYGTPHNITADDTAVPKSMTLAACSSINDQNGTYTNGTDVRVYYGAREALGVRELKATFVQGYTPSWNVSDNFYSSSPTAGVACVADRLYMQDNGQREARVLQFNWAPDSLKNDTLGWVPNWWSSFEPDIAVGTSIAATGDDLFYQYANGSVARISFDADSFDAEYPSVKRFEALGLAAENATFAAQSRDQVYGSLLFFADVNDKLMVDYASLS